jgi:hypothetical protein
MKSILSTFIGAVAAGLFYALRCFGDDAYTQDATYLGGAGNTATNAEYNLNSSWGQLTQSSVATGGDYENTSGFLAAITDDSPSLRIISFGFTTNSTPNFGVTITTVPGYIYRIQFTDSTSGPPVWHSFANTNQAVGTYVTTNNSPTHFTFIDNFTPATSGSSPVANIRFYRVDANPTLPAP